MKRTIVAVALVLSACAEIGGPSDPASNATNPTANSTTTPGQSANPDPGSDPLASSLSELRTVLHVHSAFSHDACDGNPMPGGTPDASCMNDLRDAICSVGVQFVGLTDHPAFMQSYSMDGELLFDASKGDVALVDSGVTIGNQLKCSDGHVVTVTEGYEATHTLPLVFGSQPTTTTAYGDLTDARPIADVQSMVSELKSHGALVASAHSEESDVSADTLLQAGVEAMEWYNPHGNFIAVMGADHGIGLGAIDALGMVGGMAPFLAGASSGAHADLIYLLLLPKWPQAGFDKWRTVQRTRTVTGILGSDVHENVSVAPLCTGSVAVACQLAAAASPGETQALALLAAGGKIMLSDGARLDSFTRVLRWLENRVLVSDPSPAGVRDALRAGHNYGLFTVFGAPDTFRYAGLAGSTLLEMGDQHSGPIALTVRLPSRAVALTGAQWSDADGAKVELRADLYFTSDTETTLVKESTALGDTITFTATDPGAYHVEVWAKPKQLTAPLGTQSQLANTEYLWLITNPIRVTP